MSIRISHINYQQALALLTKGDYDIVPPLSSTLDMQEYAAKLAQYATFVLAEDEDHETVGCIAFYQNREGAFLYVSHYWVQADCRGKGIARQMLFAMIEHADDYKEVRLEVSKDNPARYYYQRMAFTIVEDRGDKLLLSLSITHNQTV